jgi:hypothetical protein
VSTDTLDKRVTIRNESLIGVGADAVMSRRSHRKELSHAPGLERSDDTLSRDDGVSDHGTSTTIAESPRQSGLLYVGTDDGNVQMTRDGGRRGTT